MSAICDCQRSNVAPYIGFDDVHFRILRDSSSLGQVADWSLNPVIPSRHVPGTNITVTQFMGFGLAQVTWTLRFGCRHQYHALMAKLAQRGTLRVLYGMQSHKGVQKSILDRVYEELPQTQLIGISNVVTYVDGSVECQATFQRAIDPVTRETVVS